MSWERGRPTVERLIDAGSLEKVTGAAADVTHWLTSTTELLESARRESDSNP